MGKVRRIDFHPDEFIAGVFGQMTGAQCGVYWIVCSYIASRGGPIAEDHDLIARCLKMRRPDVSAAIDHLVATAKLSRTDDEGVVKLSQKRIESEVNASRKRIETNTKNAGGGGKGKAKQGKIRAGAKSPAKPPAPLTTNHQPSTTNNSPKGELDAGTAFTLAEEDQPHGEGQPGRGTRMTAGAKLPAAWATWARQEGHPDPQAEWESFVDYWTGVAGKDGVKTDWRGTWRNRVRKVLAEGRCAVSRKPAAEAGELHRAEFDLSLRPFLDRLLMFIDVTALSTWFTKVQYGLEPDGMHCLVAPQKFTADSIRDRFGEKLNDVFERRPWRITQSGPAVRRDAA